MSMLHGAASPERIFTPGLAQVAYSVADEAAGVAAIIDPRRDVGIYLDWASSRGVRIIAVLETHVHADFVSGAPELAAATGAPVYTSRLGGQAFPHEPLDDGDEIRVGRLRLRALWTPGHTPEHLAFLLFDPVVGDAPQYLFSGDTLFVGEVGRPDLLGREQTKQLAGQLFQTVTERLAHLPDSLIVYPGHTAGSACGKKIGDAPSTTIGQEKLVNYAFRAQREEQFIDAVLTGMPLAPTYYPTLKRINRLGAPPLAGLPAGDALEPDEIAARRGSGTLTIDARSPRAFGAGHLPGAYFAGLGPNFVAWVGWLAPYDRDIILVLDSDEAFAEARTALHRIGVDRVAGFLAGGMAAWRAAARETVALSQITVAQLHTRLSGGGPITVLDVRSDDEWADGHIAGAVHTFAGAIVQGADLPTISDSGSVAVICGSGYRSTVVCSFLATRGFDNLLNVSGGMDAWREANLPMTRGR